MLMDYRDDDRYLNPSRGAAPVGRVPGNDQSKLVRKVIRPPATRNMNQLILNRAADRFNKQAAQNPAMGKLTVVLDGDTFFLRLERPSDGAVLHQSRPLPIAAARHTNVNEIIRRFSANQSLKRFDIFYE